MPVPGSAGCRSPATRCERPSSISSRSGREAAPSRGSTRVASCASGRAVRGADPGPVCYRGGGVEPTVTDANVVLGRLNPKYFLGGEIGLDVDGAARAIDERCAQPLGLTVTEAANGIVEIANAAMVNALHLISVQRGYDPRDFVLVGFGGAGPVHANALARDAEMPTLLIPRSPGIFSATGLLDDRSQARYRDDDHATPRRPRPCGGRCDLRRARGRRTSRARARGARRRGDLVPPAGRSAVRRPELRADDSRRRGPARAVPRRARSDVRLRGTDRARRGGQPAADERRHDREAAGEATRGRRVPRAEGAAAGLLRRGRGLRRLPDLRSLRAARGRALRRAGDRGGVRLDHRRSPGVSRSRSTRWEIWSSRGRRRDGA